MQVRSRIVGSLIVLGLLLLSTAAMCEDLPAAASAAQTNTVTAGDPLLQMLVAKGVINAQEAKSLVGTPAEQKAKLLELLRQKGILSASDYETLTTPSASAQVDANLVASTTPILPAMISQAPAPTEPPKPAPPAVIPAVAPVRVFPVDAPKTGGLNGIKVGPLTVAPYGFIKATIVHDSSAPDGDDFPFPGLFLNSGSILSTGPTKDPEVHVKARSTRFGLNLEWPDMSKNLTLTGKIEGDFEGNFSEVDNRDVSSIRSNQPQLRLAFVRLDYHASENTDIFFVGGQDWTLFGSGAMMNILETTFNGAFWGNTYTRSPQLRVGLLETLSKENNVKLEGQFGVMMPSTGQILKLGSLGLAGQIGEGERAGADSDRPEWEGRAALSFQLDKAKGVAPAQIAFAGFRSRRTSIVPNSSYTFSDYSSCGTSSNPLECSLESAFPNGFQASSKMWGGQIVAQLPTRWFTLVASAYKGGDLRFYFGGQINSFATDTFGLTAVSKEYATLDGGPLAAAGASVLGCTAALNVDGTCPSGSVAIAPQRPIRSFGGFLQLGLPLSRWFNADPKGHNAGWQLSFTVGKDQVVDRDLNNPNFTGNANVLSPLPLLMGKSAIVTLNYKFNNWCGFSFEQSIYATRIFDHANAYTIAGVASNEWQDHRTEFGPIFTF
jgi:hypothetical protein